VSEHARIGFVASIGNCANRLDNLTVVRIGMCTIHRWRRRYICRWCVSISVSDCGRGCNFFATLCEIPMGQNLSVLLSMIVAGAVIVLKLSVKYWRVIVRWYCCRWLWQNAVIVFAYFDCIAYLSSCTKVWIASLQHAQHNNKSKQL
jgi:hypothetical protein